MLASPKSFPAMLLLLLALASILVADICNAECPSALVTNITTSGSVLIPSSYNVVLHPGGPEVTLGLDVAPGGFGGSDSLLKIDILLMLDTINSTRNTFDLFRDKMSSFVSITVFRRLFNRFLLICIIRYRLDCCSFFARQFNQFVPANGYSTPQIGFALCHTTSSTAYQYILRSALSSTAADVSNSVGLSLPDALLFGNSTLGAFHAGAFVTLLAFPDAFISASKCISDAMLDQGVGWRSNAFKVIAFMSDNAPLISQGLSDALLRSSIVPAFYMTTPTQSVHDSYSSLAQTLPIGFAAVKSISQVSGSDYASWDAEVFQLVNNSCQNVTFQRNSNNSVHDSFITSLPATSSLLGGPNVNLKVMIRVPVDVNPATVVAFTAKVTAFGFGFQEYVINVVQPPSSSDATLSGSTSAQSTRLPFTISCTIPSNLTVSTIFTSVSHGSVANNQTHETQPLNTPLPGLSFEYVTQGSFCGIASVSFYLTDGCQNSSTYSYKWNSVLDGHGIDCTMCPVGSYSNVSTAGLCIICPDGYAPAPGQNNTCFFSPRRPTIADAPSSGGAYIFLDQGSSTSFNISANDTDVDDYLTLRMSIAVLPSRGQLTWNGNPVSTTQELAPPDFLNAATNTSIFLLTYTPNPDYFGEDYLQYFARDRYDLVSLIGTVRLYTNHVNHRPVSESFSVFGLENVPFPITQFNYSDNSGDMKTDAYFLHIISSSTRGQLQSDNVNVAGGDVLAKNYGDRWYIMFFPDPDTYAEIGPYASFEFQICDDSGVAGSNCSETQVVTIYVAPRNHRPWSQSFNISVDQNGNVSFVVPFFDEDSWDAGTPGVLFIANTAYLYTDPACSFPVYQDVTYSSNIFYFKPSRNMASSPPGTVFAWGFFYVFDGNNTFSDSIYVITAYVNPILTPPEWIGPHVLHMTQDVPGDILLASRNIQNWNQGFDGTYSTIITALPNRGSVATCNWDEVCTWISSNGAVLAAFAHLTEWPVNHTYGHIKFLSDLGTWGDEYTFIVYSVTDNLGQTAHINLTIDVVPLDPCLSGFCAPPSPAPPSSQPAPVDPPMLSPADAPQSPPIVPPIYPPTTMIVPPVALEAPAGTPPSSGERVAAGVGAITVFVFTLLASFAVSV